MQRTAYSSTFGRSQTSAPPFLHQPSCIMPQAVIPSHTTLVSNGWKWDRNSLHWSIAEPRWLDLYEDFSTLSPLADPRKQVDPIILPLRFSAVPETNNRIYIRNCYGSILARINAIRRRYESSSIVLTGQPGTGMSKSSSSRLCLQCAQ